MSDNINSVDIESAGDGRVLGWLTRTYESQQDWHAKARTIYFSSNGDSELARHRVASLVRSYFLDTPPNAEIVEQWTGLAKVDEKVIPPRVTASNASYFDWLQIADYLLLPSTSTDEIEVENQRRESQFQQLLGSYNLRMQVNAARDLLRKSPSMNEAEVLVAVQREYPKASLANVKEAKRLNALREPLRQPIKPQKVSDLARYKSLA